MPHPTEVSVMMDGNPTTYQKGSGRSRRGQEGTGGDRRVRDQAKWPSSGACSTELLDPPSFTTDTQTSSVKDKSHCPQDLGRTPASK